MYSKYEASFMDRYSSKCEMKTESDKLRWKDRASENRERDRATVTRFFCHYFWVLCVSGQTQVWAHMGSHESVCVSVCEHQKYFWGTQVVLEMSSAPFGGGRVWHAANDYKIQRQASARKTARLQSLSSENKTNLSWHSGMIRLQWRVSPAQVADP